MEFLLELIRLLIALGVTLSLIFLSYRLAGKKVNEINNNRYVKVVERVQLTKDNYILIVRIGKKGYVITCTNNNMNKLEELSEEEINNIERRKENSQKAVIESYNKLFSKFPKFLSKIIKNMGLKEEKNEK